MTKIYYYALALSLLICGVIIVARNFLPPVVPLFYGKPQGEGQLTPVLGLMIAPLSAISISVINFLISKRVGDNLLQKFLGYTSLFTSILSAITILKIIFLVGFF